MLAWLGTPLERGKLALTGMVCAVTGAFRAPMTAIVMALEISHDYDLLIPVTVACAAAFLTAPRGPRILSATKVCDSIRTEQQ
jgi:H+/Cl- antiporter ClcA